MGSVHTRNLFNIFQDELKKSQGCMYKKIGQKDLVIKYEVSYMSMKIKSTLFATKVTKKLLPFVLL